MEAHIIQRMLILFLPLAALIAGGKAPVEYLEHGKVVALHTLTSKETMGVYTDSQGKTYGGGSYDVESFVFKIETADRFYELTSRHRRGLHVGDEVQFRMKKKAAYLRSGQEEQRYEITGIELKSQP